MLRTPSDGHFGRLDPHVVSSAIVDGSTDAITIPDSNLLYSGDFKRAGNDLILSDDKHKFVVQDYFLHDKHPTLLSPKGGALTPDVVLALAGSLAPGQYAQATAPQPQEQPIGRVVTVSGNVVAIRNGVSITLNTGDAVLKNDVLQTGSDGKIAVTFNDGATFSLDADARIVLTEFVYDPNGTANNSVVSLIRGQLSFIAGEVAHTGDMKVVTPVATMGIRGTVGIVSFGDSLTLTVADQQDGQVHSIAISDSSGNIIGHATSVGGTWVVTSTGVQEVARQTNVQQDLSVVQTLLNLQTTGMQIVNDLNNTKSTEQHHTSIEYQENNQQGNNTGNIKITTTTTDTGTGTGTTDNSSTKIVTETYLQVNNTSTSPPFFIDTPTITRVQLANLMELGRFANLNGVGPAVSADGNVVAFLATDKLPGQNSDIGQSDVYIYNRATNTVSSMTADIRGTQLHPGESFDSIPSISGDGHYIVFAGKYQQKVTLVDPNDANIIVTVSNDARETFIYDSRTVITTLLSGNGDAPVISADGHYVAVAATAYVWVGSGPVQESVINVIDRATGLTVDQIAIRDTNPNSLADPGVHDPALSADGKYITFTTTATSLDIEIGTHAEHFTLTGANGEAQVYRLDLSTLDAAPQLVSTGVNGAGNGNSGELFPSTGPSVTTVGNVAYTFSSSDFQAYDENGNPLDIKIGPPPPNGSLTLNVNGATHAVTQNEVITADEIANGDLVFTPSATANTDAAGYGSFSFQALSGSNVVFSSTMNVNLGHDDEWASSMSADGRYVVFESNATNLGVSNGHSNIYLYDAVARTTTLVSHDTGTDATKFGDSLRPEISADGRYITYVSFASDLIQGGTTNASGAAETYLYDTLTKQTTLVSGTNGTAANGDSQWGASVSGGGFIDAFGSTTTNLDHVSLDFTSAQSQTASGHGTNLFGLSLSDSNTSGVVTVTVKADSGTLSPNPLSGSVPNDLKVSEDDSHHTLTIQGSLASVNAALQAGLTYTPSSGSNDSSGLLTITASDPVGGATAQVTIDANGTVNEPAAGSANILVSDASHGTAAVVLDTQIPSVLTTTGTTPFTDSGTHTVKAVAQPGDWGTLTPIVSHDTTSSTLGDVTWTYQVNEALAATLAAGSTHQDTFILYLTGSGGTTAEYVTVTTVGTNETLGYEWGAQPTPETVAVLSSAGYTVDQSTLNAITNALANSVQTAHSATFVNTAAGYQFVLSGSGFTYDANGNLIGGTITEVDVRDLTNQPLLAVTGFGSPTGTIPAVDFANAVIAHDANYLALNPAGETGSTGADHITGSNANGILIGGGGGDTLTAGNGSQILVGGPGGDGLTTLPAANYSITGTATTTPLALTVDPTLLAAIQADASLSLTISGVPADATLSIGGVTKLPSADGRVTFTQAQLLNATSLTITASHSESFSLQLAGTTNEGGVFTGGAGADTFVLGGHDGAETITDFSGVVGGGHDQINLAAIPSLQSLSDVLAHATQVGADMVIDFSDVSGLSTKVTLKNVQKNDLQFSNTDPQASDFVFAQTAPSDDTSTIITNSPIGTTFILSGATPILLSNSQVSFASAPGAFGTLTQDLKAGTSALALNSGLDNVQFPYVVTSTTDGTVNTFTSVAGSTFDVAAGTFTITGGTGSGANAGTLEVSGTGTLNLSGPFTNSGTLYVVGHTLKFIDADLTGGQVTVDSGGTFDASGNSSITNASVTNHGIFEVTGGGTLTIDPTTITNTSLIEVDSGATLVLNDDTVDNTASGATIQVDDGATLTLTGTTITGGTINDQGTIEVAGASIANATVNVTNDGQLVVDSGQTLVLSGTDTISGGTLAISTPSIRSADRTDSNVFLSNISLLDLIAGDLRNFTVTVTATGGSVVPGLQSGAGGSDQLQTSGTLSQINTALSNGLTFIPDNSDGTNTLTFSVDDGQGSTAFKTLSITTAQGSAPVFDVTDATGAIENSGTIDVSGTSTLNSDALFNSGAVAIEAGQTLTLNQTAIYGGTINDQGTVEVVSARIANATVNLTNGGQLVVDSGKQLVLSGTDTITGGAFAIALGPVQPAAGNSVLFPLLSIGDLNPGDDPTVTLTIQASSGSFAAISGSGLDVNQSGDEITISGHLTDVNNALNNGITYTPDTGVTSNTLTLSVTDGSDTAFRTLSLNTSNPASPTTTNTSASGEINNAGLIDVRGTTTLSSDALFNGATATVNIETGDLLKLDDSKIYSGTITDNGTVEIAGFSAIVNAHLTGGQLTVDPTATLALSGATISSSTITDNNLIDVLSSSTINNSAQLSGGQVKVEAGRTLTLDNVTVTGTTFTETATGTIAVDAGDQLTLSGATINGGAVSLASGATLTIDNVTFNNVGINFTTGDIIDLANTTNVTSVVWNGSTLTINGTPTTFTVSSIPFDDTFAFKPDGHGGTYLAVEPQVLTVPSPSDATGAEGAPIALNFSDTVASGSSLASFVISVIPVGATLSDGIHTFTASAGTTFKDVATWNLSSLKITPAAPGSFTLSVLATAADGNGYSYTVPVTEAVTETPTYGYLYGQQTFAGPTGAHLYGPGLSLNTGLSAAALLFGVTPSGFQSGAVNSVNEYLDLYDPFLLPYRSGMVSVASDLQLQTPFKYQSLLTTVSGTKEVIAVYETQDPNHNPILNEVTISETSSGPNDPLTPGSSTQIESGLTGQISNLSLSATGSPTSSYSVAWDLYDATSSTFQIDFQTFDPANNNASISPVENPLNLSNFTSLASAPAWLFRSGGGAAPYVLALAQANGDIQFKGYNADGSPNSAVNFSVAPDLSHYAVGATSEVLVPSGATLSALQFTPNAGANSGYSAAWLDTVTDSNGTHYQVEFTKLNPTAGTTNSQTTFQVADAQNIRVSSVQIGGAGPTFDYIAYGDATSTTVIKFDNSGHEVASITDPSPTGAIFNAFTVGSNDIVTLTYGAGTSAYTTDVYDFRQTGLNQTTGSGTNYIAGTQYSDTITAGINSINLYYFEGSSTGTPSDTFIGSVTSGWNAAVFADAMSNYTIPTPVTDNGVTTDTITSSDPSHGGSLTVNNVQALIFGATEDPAPVFGTGAIEITDGETLVALTNYNTAVHQTTIDGGGTLELDNTTLINSNGLTQQGQLWIGSGDTGATLLLNGLVSFSTGPSYGTINLDGDADKIIASPDGATLNNDTWIGGIGQIGNGDGHLTLNNQGSFGIIDANINGTIVIHTGNTVTNTGALEADGGTLQIDDVVDNSAVWTPSYLDPIGIYAQAGTIILNDVVMGGGSAVIDGGTIVFNSSSNNDAIFVSGVTGTLALAAPENFSGSITGFADGDVIDFANAASNASINYSSGSLKVDYTDASNVAHEATLNLAGTYTQSDFRLAPDSSGGTDLLWNHAPVISSATTASVNEGVAANTAIYTAVAVDSDGGTVTYALSGGTDASAFTINSSTGVVTINAVPDFETKSSYSFDVKASDPSGASNTQTVTLSVNDTVNDAPVVTVPATAFTTLVDPALSNIQAIGINDAGIIVGQGDLDSNHQRGWSYNGTTFTTIDDGGAQDTSAHAITSSGIIIGDYSPSRSTPRYGFIDNNGSFTQVASDSPYPSTNANGINDVGVIVGSDYLHSGARYSGYIYNNGSFTYLQAPGANNGSGDTFCSNINNNGVVVGTFNTNANVQSGYQGFTYLNGVYTTFADPLAVNGTFAEGINDAGQVVGFYDDAASKAHGFVYSGGVFTTIDDPLGTNATVVTGINNVGQIVGYYVDGNGSHAFESSVPSTTLEDHALTINGVSVADIDAGSAQIKVTLAVAHGSLTLGSEAGLDSVANDHSGSVDLFGSQTAIDAALATGIVYTPTANYNGNDTLTVTANDQGNTGTGGAQTGTQTVGITVYGPPALSIVHNALSVNQYGTVSLGISEAPGNQGDSITISGIPTGSALSAGTNNGGSWTLTSAQLTGLALTAGGIDGLSYASPTAATLNVPSAGNTQLVGINDAGYIFANINNGVFTNQAELFDGTNWTTVHYNAAGTVTVAGGLNNAGDVVGDYTDNSYAGTHGFLLHNGVYTAIDDGANGTEALGINDAGVIVGVYFDAGTVAHAFIKNGATFINFDDPSAGSGKSTTASGINNAGEVVGTYVDAGNVSHGYLYDGTNFATLDDASAGSGANQGTTVTGINNQGEIVGFYVDSSGHTHGFVDNNGVFTTIDNANATNGSYVNGVNDAGELVGTFNAAAANGFTAIPTQDLHVTATNPAGTTSQDIMLTMSPAISTVDQQVTDNGNSSTLSGLLISDVLASSDPQTVTAVAGQGTLAFAQSEPNLTPISDGSNGTLSASGSLADINKMLLDGVNYTPTAVNNALPDQDHIAVTILDHNGATDSVNFIFNVAGQTDANGNISLNGTSGNDVIYNTSVGNNAGGTTDTLTGYAGSDTFVFRSFSPQTEHNDIVADFNVNQDFLNFDHATFAHISDILASAHADPNNAANTVITVDTHNIITLNNITVAQLDQHQSHIIVA